MLEVIDLGVCYGTTIALHGVSLTVGDGEVVALLGPNGAGKTSLLRAITHLTPFSGTVRFDGVDTVSSTTEELARRGLIHVPEGRHIFPTLSVLENLQMGEVAAAGRPSTHTIDDVFDLFPALVPLRQRKGFALSGGEQQMLAIGRALVASPRLLLLDEPSLGLAPLVASAVFGALAEIRSATPVLLVEQNSTLALGLADRAEVLSGGRVVLSDRADALADRQALLASYLGQRDAVVDA
jgi:branched-chain amino acid transport system ATP-binding protein